MSGGSNLAQPALCIEQADEPLPVCLPQGLTRYQPLRKLGSGGIAEVLLCEDQVLKRILAVKRLKKSCPVGSVDERRFLREARIMAAISNPAIPIVYDLGRDEEGRPFFVTDVLQGGDYLVNVLSGLRRGVMEIEHQFPLERLIRIIMLVCGAIEDAHKRGVIHRDIKPEHIYITGRNRVILLDWGLAKLSGEIKQTQSQDTCKPALSNQTVANNQAVVTNEQVVARPSNRLTCHGQRLGTPLYMSPEQVIDSPAIDHRTDIYSIGAVLYDCLVLDTLVSGRTVSEVFDQIVSGDVAKPIDVSRRRDLSADLQRVCLKAVARDPVERYQTAGQLGEALRECQLNMLASFERDLDRAGPRFNFGTPAGAAAASPGDLISRQDDALQKRRRLEAGLAQELLMGNRPVPGVADSLIPFGRKSRPDKKKRAQKSR